MDALLTAVGSVFTSAISWVGTTASTIAAQPILLLSCVAIPLCGLGVGMCPYRHTQQQNCQDWPSPVRGPLAVKKSRLAADGKQPPIRHGGCFSSTENDIFLSVLTVLLVCGTNSLVPRPSRSGQQVLAPCGKMWYYGKKQTPRQKCPGVCCILWTFEPTLSKENSHEEIPPLRLE